MALIRVPQQSEADIEAWEILEDTAHVHARSKLFRARVGASLGAIASFTARARGYVGVSWGKDSVCVAHLTQEITDRWPLVWVRVKPMENPDCETVRDAYLAKHARAAYDEIDVWCTADADEWHARGTIEQGFSRAGIKHGAQYVSGIRADESGVRKLRVATHGLVSANTCAPIGRWTSLDVFAYLVSRGLPIHPAYACTMGGLIEHGRVRVASLGGRRGDGMGRAEWERRYYGQRLAELRAMLREPR